MCLMVGAEGFGVWNRGDRDGACSPARCVHVQTANEEKKDLPLEGILIKFKTT